MSGELRECPLHGGRPHDGSGTRLCNCYSVLADDGMTDEEWNTRPAEARMRRALEEIVSDALTIMDADRIARRALAEEDGSG